MKIVKKDLLARYDAAIKQAEGQLQKHKDTEWKEFQEWRVKMVEAIEDLDKVTQEQYNDRRFTPRLPQIPRKEQQLGTEYIIGRLIQARTTLELMATTKADTTLVEIPETSTLLTALIQAESRLADID